MYIAILYMELCTALSETCSLRIQSVFNCVSKEERAKVLIKKDMSIHLTRVCVYIYIYTYIYAYMHLYVHISLHISKLKRFPTAVTRKEKKKFIYTMHVYILIL